MSFIPPLPGFLETLREQCDKYGAVLIFDEVMTGFRVALGGAQSVYGIKPDLTTLGKVIGGGMPVGAFGGRRDIMEQLAPLGGVYHAGTLSGNPIAMTAGLATLEIVEQPGFFEDLEVKTEKLMTGMKAHADASDIPFSIHFRGGMFGFFFSPVESVSRFSEVMNADSARFNAFFRSMLDAGINLAPSPFESGFVSSAHGDEEINATLNAAESAMKALA